MCCSMSKSQTVGQVADMWTLFRTLDMTVEKTDDVQIMTFLLMEKANIHFEACWANKGDNMSHNVTGS